jgi:hypothetical protein
VVSNLNPAHCIQFSKFLLPGRPDQLTDFRSWKVLGAFEHPGTLVIYDKNSHRMNCIPTGYSPAYLIYYYITGTRFKD